MIHLRKEDLRWTITIDRVDKANSLTKGMLEQIEQIAEQAAAEVPKVVVFTGAGKVFSAGADLDQARAGLATDGVWERVSGKIAALPCLTITALNGTLAGGAFGMVLACDLRITVPEAKFFYPVMKLGFLPQPSDPARMSALIGPARTKMVLLAGQKLTAQEAYTYGLVDRIVAREDLASVVSELAADCESGKPDVLTGIQSLIPGND